MYIKSGYLLRRSDMLAILSAVAVVFGVASGICYLSKSVNAPMHTRIFAGPVTI